MTNRCTYCGTGDWCNCALDHRAQACARGCLQRDRHANCTDDNCTGCLPKRARHGVLCETDHNRLTAWLTGDRGLTWAYGWLGENIARGGTTAARQDWQRPAGKDGPPLPIRETVHDIRVKLSDRVYEADEQVRDEFDRPARDTPFDLAQSCQFLRAWLTKIEEVEHLALHIYELFDEVMRETRLACPWADRPRPIIGIACPHCETESLARYPGDENVTCRTCWAKIAKERYTIWVRMLADEVTA
jgi:hypothetical protein